MNAADEKRMYQAMLFTLKKVANAPDADGNPELEKAQQLARAYVDIEARQQRGEATGYEFRLSAVKGVSMRVTYPDGSVREFPYPGTAEEFVAIGMTTEEWIDATPDAERFMVPRAEESA